MAVFKQFPESDTFIYTEAGTSNHGSDEVLELGGYPLLGQGHTSRMILKFNNAKTKQIIDSFGGGVDIKANLKLYLCTAYEVPTNFVIYGYPVSESYINGIGKIQDNPINTSGVSWYYRTAGNVDRWLTPAIEDVSGAMAPNTTSSYNDTFAGGGGNWWTGSNGVNLEATQSFPIDTDGDINLDVTNIVNTHYSESIENNGIILKLDDSLEFNQTASIQLKYYGRDTNTIFPPCLELKWDDSSYVTGSLSVLGDSQPVININNNKGTYKEEGKQRFRILARPKYPVREFTTSSVYLKNYALPSASYWAIKDEHSEEMIIDFDTSYTKVSCDATSSYFDVFMDGLQPERYYRLLIKTEIDGSSIVVDDKNIFKVVRNV